MTKLLWAVGDWEPWARSVDQFKLDLGDFLGVNWANILFEEISGYIIVDGSEVSASTHPNQSVEEQEWCIDWTLNL